LRIRVMALPRHTFAAWEPRSLGFANVTSLNLPWSAGEQLLDALVRQAEHVCRVPDA
jgi:hypothetical protein